MSEYKTGGKPEMVNSTYGVADNETNLASVFVIDDDSNMSSTNPLINEDEANNDGKNSVANQSQIE